MQTKRAVFAPALLARAAVAPALATLLATGCPSPMPPAPDNGLKPLPALAAAPLVTDRSIEAVRARGNESERPPYDPVFLDELRAEGFGEVRFGAGVEVVPHTLDGAAPPLAGANARLLTRFVHLADTQLADDESPARVVRLDSAGVTAGAFRPQEAWGCRMLNAMTRTLSRCHADTPFDFVVLGGDNADNAQENEIGWFSDILTGAPSVECDSGDDDDPTPGPGNDPKDPFFAAGLPVPWFWVTGNHDVLNQGTVALNDENRAGYVGTSVRFGTRRWDQGFNNIIESGPTVADLRRRALTRPELMAKIAGHDDGHGLVPDAHRTDGKAFYAFDAAEGAVRMVVLDSADDLASASGFFRRSDLETRVRPLLEKAEADGALVIILSHHAATSLSAGSGLGGAGQSDAVLTSEWRDFISEFPHVVLHLGAHSHEYRTREVSGVGGHQWFESESASLADWPGQARVVEVSDEDNGFIKVRLIPVDYAVDDDPLAAEARSLQAVDLTSGWLNSISPEPGAVELFFPKP